jgi:hypothetical protein
VGALVTLELPPDSPVHDLPWIITFGPLTDAEDWEPVVCGPYERPHALALAEEVVTDEELMAVVEPLMGYVAPDEIRDEIAIARDGAFAGPPDQDEDARGGPSTDGTPTGSAASETFSVPSPAEIRAGMARVVRRLAE